MQRQRIRFVSLVRSVVDRGQTNIKHLWKPVVEGSIPSQTPVWYIGEYWVVKPIGDGNPLEADRG